LSLLWAGKTKNKSENQLYLGPGSSAWQSDGFVNRRSWVQSPLGALHSGTIPTPIQKSESRWTKLVSSFVLCVVKILTFYNIPNFGS
jgi:hypothetical protein